MHVDEIVGHLLQRSRSACAKYALARPQDLVGPLQLPNLSLQYLDPGGLGATDTVPLTDIPLVLLNPLVEYLGSAADLNCNRLNRCSLGMGARCAARSPSVPNTRALPGRMSPPSS